VEQIILGMVSASSLIRETKLKVGVVLPGALANQVALVCEVNALGGWLYISGVLTLNRNFVVTRRAPFNQCMAMSRQMRLSSVERVAIEMFQFGLFVCSSRASSNCPVVAYGTKMVASPLHQYKQLVRTANSHTHEPTSPQGVTEHGLHKPRQKLPINLAISMCSPLILSFNLVFLLRKCGTLLLRSVSEELVVIIH